MIDDESLKRDGGQDFKNWLKLWVVVIALGGIVIYG